MTAGEAGNKPALPRSAEMHSGSPSLAVIRSGNRLHDVVELGPQTRQPDQTRCLAVASRFQHSALQQFLVHGVDVHAPEDLGAPCFRQHVVGVGGVHGVAHAVLQRFAKAEAVDGAHHTRSDRTATLVEPSVGVHMVYVGNASSMRLGRRLLSRRNTHFGRR